MKKSTFIGMGLALMVALPVGAESVAPLKAFKRACEAHKSASHVKKASAANVGGKDYMKVSEMAAKFKPTVTKTYGWTGKKWVLDESITYTYDASGLPITEMSVDAEGDQANTSYEYNENGKVTFKESKVSSNGVDFENYKKTEFEYDPILTNVITRRTEWLWMDLGKGKDWQLVGNNYKRTITRNEDGNITNVVIAVLFQDIYDPTQRLTVTYGEDGTATTIYEEFLNYDYATQEYYWEQGIELREIEWENTDGQIYDTDMLFIGANRIKKAFYVDLDGAQADVSAEYDENGGYTVTMEGVMYGESVEQTMVYTPLENDGYRMEITATIMGDSEYELNEEQYDEWGHMILSVDEWWSDGEPKVVNKVIGEVEYDEKGFPAAYTVSEESYDINTGEVDTWNAFRAEYFDYVDVTVGVEGVEAADGSVRYFNMQGIPVEKPSAGEILIKRVGEKAEKIRY